jgi:hypothetical protein
MAKSNGDTERMVIGMKQTTIELTKLTADEGMTLTNGEAFGKEVYLGCNDKPENWNEITDEEAAKLQEEEEVV